MAMGGTDVERVAEITKRAADIAALVPEPLREAAFNRAFDALSLGDSGPPSGTGRAGERPTRRRPSNAAHHEKEATSGDAASVLTESISRTDHPEISAATRSLDRALRLLRIAENEHGIDGMTASQIAKVLTEKFRLRVTRQAIGQALDNAGTYVDRIPQGRGAARYRLMAPGEDYLDGRGVASENSVRRTAPQRKARKTGRPPIDKASPSRRRAGRSPKALVEELIAEGFFKEARTLGQIQERLRHKKGVSLKAGDLSPTLVRLLRQNSLDRERNEEKQYEYRVPT